MERQAAYLDVRIGLSLEVTAEGGAIDSVCGRGLTMGARYRQGASVEAVSLQDEMILFQPEVNKFYVLNHTASVIWTSLVQPATSEDIAAGLSTQFADVVRENALADVEEALEQMVVQQLVTQVS